VNVVHERFPRRGDGPESLNEAGHLKLLEQMDHGEIAIAVLDAGLELISDCLERRSDRNQ
jgi:hypothetical protein